MISNPGLRMGARRRPLAFTEQGLAMLSSVLRSKRAIQVNIAIMRAFVTFREMLATHKGLADKLAELEQSHGAGGRIRTCTPLREEDSRPKRKGRRINV